jgi:hypothetical protein
MIESFVARSYMPKSSVSESMDNLIAACEYMHMLSRPCGLALADGSQADVFANTVSENSPYGVLVMDTACGHVYNNSISRNDLAQVKSSSCSCLFLRLVLRSVQSRIASM